MNIIKTKPRTTSLRAKHASTLRNIVRTGFMNFLSMYAEPPTSRIQFIELHQLGLLRLKILQLIDDACIENKKVKLFSVDFYNKLKLSYSQLKQGSDDGIHKLDSPESDLISHYILRLAFCRTTETRRWLIQSEVELFRWRLHEATTDDIKALLTTPSLSFIEPVALETLDDDAKHFLLTFQYSYSGRNMDKLTLDQLKPVYKVPFTQALDLIKDRRAYVQGGYAYVPSDLLYRILISRFRSSLSQCLVILSRYFGRIQEDPRLHRIVQQLGARGTHTGSDYLKTSDKNITPEMLDQLVAQSYPLCMQEIHQKLRSEHHLKHGGRMQYGLFLKGIGVTMEDSMRFWRAEFTKNMPEDKFDKQYAYNIRHNYGTEGKRVSYTPYSCLKIIMSNPPGPQDYHGCPFKHSDADHLLKKLRGLNLRETHIDLVMKYAKDKNYQSACTRYFECTHGLGEHEANTISHPNMYFEQSRNVKQDSSSTSGYRASQGYSASAGVTNSSSADAKCDDDNLDAGVLEEMGNDF